MKRWLQEVHWIGRELRGSWSRWTLFAASLAVGVAALVAVSGLATSIRKGLERESRRLLAADLKIESRQPFPQELLVELERRPGTRVSPQVELITVVRSPKSGRSQLVELKAVSPGYPFYGEVQLEPPGTLEAALSSRGVVAPAELLTRLNLQIGDTIEVGGEPFPVVTRLISEPDRLSTAFALGPRLFLPYELLESTGLTRFGSRVTYRLLVQSDRAEELASELRNLLGDSQRYRLETTRDGLPELRQGLERAERFLLLVALVSLILGGLGVAQTVRLWLADRLDALAVWKSLGASSGELTRLYFAQCLLLASAGSLLGILAGQGLVWLLPSWIGGLLGEIPRGGATLGPVWIGLGVGVGVALGFASLPLHAALRVPAVRVLRREVEPLPVPLGERLFGLLLVAATVWAAAWFLARSATVAWAFSLALGGVSLLLSWANQGILAAARRVPRRALPLTIRYGWAALGRPGSVSRGALVALGIGTFVVVSVEGVRLGLLERLAAELPEDAPTAFLIDIQPSQWEGVHRTLAAEGASAIRSVPVVVGRLTSVNGRAVQELVERSGTDSRRERWALTREQRLTYLESLPEDNRIVAGKLWSDPQRPEVSVEERFARDLGIGVGSRIGFDIQGVPVELYVTSLRKVDWQSFQINFFLVVEPGVLEDAPQMRLAAARLPRGREAAIQDRVVATFPNVTLFPIRDVLDKVELVLERTTTGIRFLGAFTVASGLAILAGSLGAAAMLRSREVALMKTLGLRRAEVLGWFAVEYALAGLLAATVGATLGAVAQAEVLKRAFTIDTSAQPGLVLSGVAAVTVLATLAGLLASLRSLSRSPAEVFRS